jgi:hypothetical protein
MEKVFGWIKTTGGLSQIRVRGLDKEKTVFTVALAAYNIIRLPN